MRPENDIYVFYEKSDNKMLENDKYGWVDNFKRFLKMMLRQIMGTEPNLLELREGRLPSADDLSEIAALILILTPDTVKSGKVIKVMDSFRSTVKVENPEEDLKSNRIFKILKSPVAAAEQPVELRSLIGYDLYYFNPVTGEAQEFDNFFSHEAENNYWMKMVDLAYDLNELFNRFQDNSEEVGNGRIRQSIFLAETGPELVIQRNRVKRELQRLGYSVFPKQNLPDERNEISEMMKTLLDHCFVTIHLMGEHVDIEEDGTASNIVTFQNDIVSNYIKESDGDTLKNFSRLIWLSQNFRVTEEKHHRFIEKLRREVEDTGRTEIFQTPFEDFKFLLKKTLPEIPEKLSEVQGSEDQGDRKKIYLIYDIKDAQNVTPLIDLVSKRGYEVLKPSFDGNLMDIRKSHIRHLVDFDGVIIYSGEVNEFWVRMKLLDILKSPGFGRLKPLDKKAILSSGTVKINKDNFKTYEVDVIETDKITEKALDTFLTKMN